MGRGVLPAVEAMQLLAASTLAHLPDADVRSISSVQFRRFLFLPPAEDRTALPVIEARNDLQQLADGRLCATLSTRFTAPKSGISRRQDHVCVTFGGSSAAVPPPPRIPASLSVPIPSEAIYRELVPLGPAFRNLTDGVCLSPHGAAAAVYGGQGHSDHSEKEGPLGSGFTLDAAFHAACVWGQRHADMVPFPVAIARREVFLPTRFGETYRAWVEPASRADDNIVFNIWIVDGRGRVQEAAIGVEMRDVSGGRLKPPEWIRRLDLKGAPADS